MLIPLVIARTLNGLTRKDPWLTDKPPGIYETSENEVLITPDH